MRKLSKAEARQLAAGFVFLDRPRTAFLSAMNGSQVLRHVRTLVVLGRVSNLPTVWSNCLAGWWLSSGVRAKTLAEVLPWLDLGKLALLLLGASCLYLGGMCLNDAFDAEFDREFRPNRPIASGSISRETVWIWSFVCLGIGALLLILLGRTTGILALDLVVLIVLYDAFHKRITLAPVLMGLCRWLLYLIAASTAAPGIHGTAIWCGLALALYVTGLSFFARKEATTGAPDYWPCALLAAPILLAFVLNGPGYREAALLLSLILALWILRSLRAAFWSTERQTGQAVSLLLAGIVFVDWLAVADAPKQAGFVFVPLFLLALALQRFVPAS